MERLQMNCKIGKTMKQKFQLHWTDIFVSASNIYVSKKKATNTLIHYVQGNVNFKLFLNIYIYVYTLFKVQLQIGI